MTEPYRARRQYFGRTALDYDHERRRSVYDRWKWNRERAAVARMLDDLAVSGRVLDLPTGTGRFLDLLARNGRSSVGCDVSPAMLALARERASDLDAPLAGAEAERLPFPDGVFEIVVSIRFFQHLPVAAVEPILRELVRVAENGVLLQAPFSNPLSPLVRYAVDLARRSPRGGHRQPSSRYFPRSLGDFRADLERWGFALQAVRPVTWRGGQLRLVQVVSGSELRGSAHR